MSRILLSLLSFFTVLAFAQNGELTLTSETIDHSQSSKVLFFEDKEKTLSLEELLALPDSDFFTVDLDIPNFDFTTSKYWVKFSVTNKTEEDYFILETARPISNKVILYELDCGIVSNSYKSGDDFAYAEKAIPHPKNLFPLFIEPGQTRDYVLEVESDGEVLIMEIRIFDKIDFFEDEYASQFSFGFYYGLMALVVIIYFFFFVLLKDKSFLYYVGYVLAQGLLQFSLDGFAFHIFFPSGGYIANHFVLFTAGVTIFVLLKYVHEFLHLKEKLPRMHKVFIGCQILVSLGVVLSLIPGITYVIAYPLINGISLISIVLSVVAIYILIFKGEKVDRFFAAAFTVLISGAIIFILVNFGIIGDAETAQTALKISSALEVAILSISMSNKYRVLQKEKKAAQEAALKSLEEKNALMDDINTKLEAQVKERTAEIEHQKEQLAESNKEILDSIHYAKRIQEAILPSAEHVRQLLPKSFVFYRPKDVVSGDFYFVEKTLPNHGNELVVFAAVDCTGHGVPGAFMSIVGSNFLNQTITEPKVNSTAQALDFLNAGVSHALRQDRELNDTTVRDGMDIALCGLDTKNNIVYFSGAKNPLYVIREGENEEALGFDIGEKNKPPLKDENSNLQLQEFKGDAHPIGA